MEPPPGIARAWLPMHESEQSQASPSAGISVQEAAHPAGSAHGAGQRDTRSLTITKNSRRVGDICFPFASLVLAGASALTFLGVLVLTSYKIFFFDEWDFVVLDRRWDISVLLSPHNEHWSTIPILVWKVLFVAVGLSSHIPYEATALIVHLMAAYLLFQLIRRRSGDLPALAAALTLLLLGSGAENIVWAFQLAWVGSVAFGLGAMLLLEGN